VRVSTSAGCGWSASANQGWIELGGSGGTGTDTLRYRVRDNSSTSSRGGAITIAGQTYTVRQDGAAPPPPPQDQRVSFSGRAFFVDGSCPNLSFFVDFRRVVTNGETKFKGGRCQGISSGDEVSGEGRLSDGRIVATEIDVRGRD
jgi:hypothetical protein